MDRKKTRPDWNVWESGFGVQVTYHWLHIPSRGRGTVKKSKTELLAIEHVSTLEEALNKWNGQQPGVWQYWS